jgi:hypothetical protein
MSGPRASRRRPPWCAPRRESHPNGRAHLTCGPARSPHVLRSR